MRRIPTEEDKRGNDGADALAVVGMHSVPPEVLEAALQRKVCAPQVQRVMKAVLQARFEAESHGPHDVVKEKDSDCESDCMEVDCMDLHCMELFDDDVDNC